MNRKFYLLKEQRGYHLENEYTKIIESTGEDVKRSGLKDTPKRAKEAWSFLTKGYKQDLQHLMNGAIFPSDTQGMVVVKNIEMYSLCEHHLLPFFGKCHIAYIPNKTILGLSKFARIVDMFSRRLQVQEHLTLQIAEAIEEVIKPKGVCVVMDAQHLCMMMRGVEKQDSVTTTVTQLGLFEQDKSYLHEFFTLIGKPHS